MAQAHEESFFCWDGNTLVVNILGKPGASKDAVGKPKGAQLKVSVTAQPHNGRATDYLVGFLAPLFGVRERDVESSCSAVKACTSSYASKIPISGQRFSGLGTRARMQARPKVDNSVCRWR